MTETIGTRTLIALDDREGLIRGTYHKTRDENGLAQPGLIGRDRIGLIFLTGLSATRAASGDSAVYWADAFADRGYPSIRLDLPGFGDADGDPSVESLSFINLGGYSSVLSSTIDELVARFHLAGVVLVGHCTGTVSAIYAAAASRECRGLVLMDPLFYLPATKLSKFRRELHTWVLRLHLDGFLTKLYDGAKEISLSIRRKAPPGNANFPLLRCWKKLTSTGLPILILKAAGPKTASTKPRIGEFDYIQYVVELAGRKSRIAVEVAEGAHHSFANRLGRAAVRRHTEEWLSANFPLADSEVSEAPELRQDPVVGQRSSKMPAISERVNIPKKVEINAHDCSI